jgi:WD40 repeat protein
LERITINRGVLLYGDSGVGKSSLVNAGLLPASIADGFVCERIRIQAEPGEELVLERIAASDGSFLDSVIAPSEQPSSQVAFSIECFEQQVRAACAQTELLLVFDHFEDLVVLFERSGQDTRDRLVDMLLGLLCEQTLQIKLLFIFREDYLGWIKELLAPCPDRFVSSLRLRRPDANELEHIIRGPFTQYPGYYDPEITPSLARRLLTLLAEHFEAGDVGLAEVQTVCLRLWQSKQPDVALDARQLHGILEDYLNDELDALGSDMRETAIALLSAMVTPAGTRDVVSGAELIRKVSSRRAISPSRIHDTLHQLDQHSRLVHCERRREVRLYEIASELLVPWISKQRQQLDLELARRRDQRRRLLLRGLAGSATVIAALLAGLSIWALSQRAAAKHSATISQREAVTAASLALVSVAQERLEDRPDVSLMLAQSAYAMRPGGQALDILTSTLQEIAATGAVGILHGAVTGISSLAFSPNGKVIAAGTNRGSVLLWNVDARRQVAEISMGTSPVQAVEFDPTGQALMTADTEGAVGLWNTSTYRPLGRTIEANRGLKSAVFSPDGRILAVGGLSGPISIWSVPDRRKIGTIAARDTGSIAFSPNGQTLAAGSYEHTVRLWDVDTHRPLGAPMETLSDLVTEVAFTPDGRMLASLTTELFTDGLIQLWDVATHKQIGKTIGGHKEISRFAFGTQGRTLIAGGNAGTTLLSVSGRAIGQLLSVPEHVEAVALARTGALAASADGTLVELTRMTPARPLETFHDHLHSGRTAAKQLGFDEDEHTLVSISEAGEVRHWSSATRIQRGATLKVTPADTQCRVISPRGGLIASVDRSGTIWLQNPGRGRARSLSGDAVFIENYISEYDLGCEEMLSISPDSQMLAAVAGRANDEVQLWNASTRDVVGRLKRSDELFRRVSFSSNGSMLATVCEPAPDAPPSQIQLWNVKDDKQVGRTLTVKASVGQLAVSPDGHTVAFIRRKEASTVGHVLLWQPMTQRPPVQLPLKQAEQVNSIALSPNGQTLVTASGEAGETEEVAVGQIRLWDLATRQALGSPIAEAGEPIIDMAFNATGTALAFLSREGDIKLWQGILWAGLPELRDKVCGLVGEGLTRTEWGYYVPGIPYRNTC